MLRIVSVRNDVQMAVRLPARTVERVDVIVGVQGTSRAEVVRVALEAYLYRLECEADAAAYEDAPLTGAEVAAAGADDWSGTPPW